jgi:hypothetical protein
MTKIATLLLVLLGMAIGLDAQSEDCNSLTPKQAFENARVIFIGKVIGEVNVPKELQEQNQTEREAIVGYRMSVQRRLKGPVNKEPAVFTYILESPFSFPVHSQRPADKNRTYLVYVGQHTNVNFIYPCSGTQDVYAAGYFLSYFGLGERLKESKNTVLKKLVAPPDSLKAFRDFFSYVKKVNPDIVSDRAAQSKWLTNKLRKGLMDYAARAGSPSENPGYPGNSDFLGVWNTPTTYSIIDTRYYDYVADDKTHTRRVMIDVLYAWGHESTMDNQYPGVRNLHTFCFVLEDGAWKLEDIYVFDDPFTSSESLLQFFRDK